MHESPLAWQGKWLRMALPHGRSAANTQKYFQLGKMCKIKYAFWRVFRA